MTVEWSTLVNPDESDCRVLIEHIEETLGHPLHEVVRKHLFGSDTAGSMAFPRCEAHFESYLFGEFFLPTSSTDGLDEFYDLTFVATFGHVWSVLRCPNREAPSVMIFEARLANIGQSIADYRSSGEILGRVFTVAVGALEEFLGETGGRVQTLLDEVERIEKLKHLSRALQDEIPELRAESGRLRLEVESLTAVIQQLEIITGEIVADRLDLHRRQEDGTVVELFERSTEIHLIDTHFRVCRLGMVRNEQVRRLEHVADTIRQLRDADEVTTGRFMGAIASIMLFPTFIAGLYGMNFDKMPEIHWPFGYGMAVVLIFVTTFLQVWFFRRRRWI
jgi:magnesium transporter